MQNSAEYLQKHLIKTSSKLQNTQKLFGLSFQIKDDILSEIGDEKILGKPVGNDRKKHKVTFVTKYGLEKAKDILDKTIDKANNEIDKFRR